MSGLPEVCIESRYVADNQECTNCHSYDDLVIVSRIFAKDEDLGFELRMDIALCPSCLKTMGDEIFADDVDCDCKDGECFH